MIHYYTATIIFHYQIIIAKEKKNQHTNNYCIKN